MTKLSIFHETAHFYKNFAVSHAKERISALFNPIL